MEKIQKIIANRGYTSRRKAEELIMQGKVYVDGKKASIGDRIDENANISIDGKEIVGTNNKVYFLLRPITNILNLPPEILPMAFLRPISGTASMSIMTKIFEIYGPDTYPGRLASVLQGCTDTTIYVIALYYSSVKITKSRYTVVVGLMADLVGLIMAFVLTRIFF